MEAFLVILGATLLGILIPASIGTYLERKQFNNGKCRKCGGNLYHFDTDSQGGRGYSCENIRGQGCGGGAWVSWPWVDKGYKYERV